MLRSAVLQGGAHSFGLLLARGGTDCHRSQSVFHPELASRAMDLRGWGRTVCRRSVLAVGGKSGSAIGPACCGLHGASHGPAARRVFGPVRHGRDSLCADRIGRWAHGIRPRTRPEDGMGGSAGGG